jgi:hypothetical protein
MWPHAEIRVGLHVKYSLLSDFNQKLTVSMFTTNTNSDENPFSGSRAGYMRTDFIAYYQDDNIK